MRTPLRWARRTAYLLALLDVAIAVLWSHWVREQGYAEQAGELELRVGH